MQVTGPADDGLSARLWVAILSLAWRPHFEMPTTTISEAATGNVLEDQ